EGDAQAGEQQAGAVHGETSEGRHRLYRRPDRAYKAPAVHPDGCGRWLSLRRHGGAAPADLTSAAAPAVASGLRQRAQGAAPFPEARASQLLDEQVAELHAPAVLLQADVPLVAQDAGVRLGVLARVVVQVGVDDLFTVQLDPHQAALAGDDVAVPLPDRLG